MSWQSELDELRAREMLARQMGGADKVERQHSGGRLTVRERIDALVDAGTFHEVGAIAGRASYDAAGNLTALVPANCIFGRAQIDGRPVVVAAEDFTVKAGTISAAANAKRHRAAELTVLDRVPLVMLLEGAGFRADARGHAGTRTPWAAATVEACRV